MSTIVGNIRDFGLTLRQAEVRFRLLTHPLIIDDDVILPGERTIRSLENGQYSLTMCMGDYQVQFNRRDMFKISVPDDDQSYNIIQLIITAVVYNPSSIVAGTIPNASSTVLGLVRTHITSATPIVPLYSEMVAADDALADLIGTAQASANTAQTAANDARFMMDTLPAGQTLTIPAQRQIVVADEFTVEAGAELTVNGILTVI